MSMAVSTLMATAVLVTTPLTQKNTENKQKQTRNQAA
jgi:hypothetical protein